MPSELSRYTLRTEQILLDKIRYIAEENGRSANKEIEQLIKKQITEYEKLHGQIPVEEFDK